MSSAGAVMQHGRRIAQPNPDVVIKLLLIGDSGVGKSCLLVRFANDSFSSAFHATLGVDFKIRKLNIGDKLVKLEVWDTAGQERFRTITQAYYRGAMGVLIVYDVTNEMSFNNIKGWMRSIVCNAPDNVNKILVGNKSDIADEKRSVPYSKGKALADEFNMQFFETSAKTNANVDEAFGAIAVEVMARLDQRDQQEVVKPSGTTVTAVSLNNQAGAKKSGCC